MLEKPIKIAIINRSFWPLYPVVGEALLRFAEGAANREHSVSVIMQDRGDIKAELRDAARGKGVRFYPVKGVANSASGILLRICEVLFFMLWVVAVLIWVRPSRVYISTDPPIVIPFVVMLYSQLFGAKYIYHLQDIHPEAANIILPVNKWIYKLLLGIDSISMRKATRLVTITDQMAEEIQLRSETTAPIFVLNNPSVSFDGIVTNKPKILGFSFCGNVGRFQRVPLILDAIETYFKRGGRLEFHFAGGGLYANHLKNFSAKFPRFHYYGLVSSTEAAQINANYTWALLTIEDEVTRFAFPSRLSSYVYSGANILAVCGDRTSVAQYVNANRVGLVVKPDMEAIIKSFFEIEKGSTQDLSYTEPRDALKAGLGFEAFVETLDRVVFA